MFKSLKHYWFKVMIVSLLFGSAFAEKAVLFVSLGMPDAALKLYLKQAKEYSIPVVVRGLYTNKAHDKGGHPLLGSFKDTAQRIKNLIGKNGKGGVSIDPILFKAFGVSIVPALVVYNDSAPCLDKVYKSRQKPIHSTTLPECGDHDFDVVYGNIPLKKMLTLIAEHYDSGIRSSYSIAMLDQKGEWRREESL